MDIPNLIVKLTTDFPDLRFKAGPSFSWSPETQEIFYAARSAKPGPAAAAQRQTTWSLLHETGHALLGHKSYKADFELLRLEIEAWEKAREVGQRYRIKISEDHIQDCLDTYRDWLHKRSICPNCSTRSLQQGDYKHYRCFNCHKMWRVSASRFCRAYRRSKDVPQEKMLATEA